MTLGKEMKWAYRYSTTESTNR